MNKIAFGNRAFVRFRHGHLRETRKRMVLLSYKGETVMARKKLPDGEGSLVRRFKTVRSTGKDGRVKKTKKYHGNYMWQYSEGGKLKSVNLGTKDYNAACVEKSKRMKERQRGDGTVVDRNITVIQYVKNWKDRRAVQEKSRTHPKDDTITRYNTVVENFTDYMVGAGLEHMLLRNAPKTLLGDFHTHRRTCTSGGKPDGTLIAESTANFEFLVMRRPFQEAFDDGLTSVNIGYRAKLHKSKPNYDPLPTIADILEVEAEITEESVKLYMMMVALHGMRRDEAIFLKWANITFGNNENEGVIHICEEPWNGGWTTKNDGSIRDIPLQKQMYHRLKDLRDKRRTEPPMGYIFLQEGRKKRGRPMAENEGYPYDCLQKAVDRVNARRKTEGRELLPPFNFLQLRRHYITWGLTRKKHRITLAEMIKRVGHKDAKMILEHYLRLSVKGAAGEKERNAGFSDDDPEMPGEVGDEGDGAASSDMTQFSEIALHSLREATFSDDEDKADSA